MPGNRYGRVIDADILESLPLGQVLKENHQLVPHARSTQYREQHRASPRRHQRRLLQPHPLKQIKAPPSQALFPHPPKQLDTLPFPDPPGERTQEFPQPGVLREAPRDAQDLRHDSIFGRLWRRRRRRRRLKYLSFVLEAVVVKIGGVDVGDFSMLLDLERCSGNCMGEESQSSKYICEGRTRCDPRVGGLRRIAKGANQKSKMAEALQGGGRGHTWRS
ncbi:hypothetical protein BHM03_00027011 [Ensete ventricosum]|nr:hypothetical protein BHM03_00027011 [Ensete ventricosum]